MFDVISRCFQIMMENSEESWRKHSDLVIAPDTGDIPWDGFGNGQRLIEAGERAAEQALPAIRRWLRRRPVETPAPLVAPAHALIEA
jgi:hypothetical protein